MIEFDEAKGDSKAVKKLPSKSSIVMNPSRYSTLRNILVITQAQYFY